MTWLDWVDLIWSQLSNTLVLVTTITIYVRAINLWLTCNFGEQLVKALSKFVFFSVSYYIAGQELCLVLPLIDAIIKLLFYYTYQ